MLPTPVTVRRLRPAAGCPLLLAVALAWPATPSSAAGLETYAPAADSAVSPIYRSATYGKRQWLRVGGQGRWRSYLSFKVPGPVGPSSRAVLLLRARNVPEAGFDVDTVLGPTGQPLSGSWTDSGRDAQHTLRIGSRVASWKPSCKEKTRQARVARCRLITVDLTAAVRTGQTFHLVLVSKSRHPVQIVSREADQGRPHLQVTPAQVGTAPSDVSPPDPGSPDGPPAAPGSPGASPAPGSTDPPGVAVQIPAAAVPGIWTTPAELASKPTSGPAWSNLKKAADGNPGTADLSDQNSDHDINILASALVYARTGASIYQGKAAAGIAAAIGTEAGGRTLALGRNLASYVIAADLISLRDADPALDARFRAWLSAVRTENLGGESLISTSEARPNNWGLMAGASRVAADAYLGDQVDLDRAARVFKGWLGDRASYASFKYGDVSWQADPSRPVGIQPVGATKKGLLIDGALADDMRRCGKFNVPPCHTDYAWEGMQGVVVEAMILARRGYDAFGWQSRAVLRAAQLLDRLDQSYGTWWATSDDEWQPWIINRAYGTTFRASTPASPGKIMGWTDWSLG
jgi:hypothetical protein